jgi:Ca2+-binding RTX toxin-like protein
MASFIGTAGTDSFTGTALSDTFDLTQGGDDTASGLDGKDLFDLGGALTAADAIDGGLGIDSVLLTGNYAAGITFGATTLAGMERLVFGSGFSYKFVSHDTTISAGATLLLDGSALGAGDTLYFDGENELDGVFHAHGGAGADTFGGGDGDDRLSGAGGDDLLAGSAGQNRLSGDDGNDHLYSHGQNDLLLGGAGDDLIELYNGSPQTFARINSGDGDDTVHFWQGVFTGPNALRGGSGTDTLVMDELLFGFANGRLELRMPLFSAASSGFEVLTVHVEGALEDFPPLFVGNNNANIIDLSGFTAGAASNAQVRIYSHRGDDTVTGWAALANHIHGGDGADLLSGGSTADELWGENGDDHLVGGAGNDSLLAGGNGDDTIEGGDGDDRLAGDSGTNLLDGGSGDDRIVVASATDEAFGGDGNDVIDVTSGIDATLTTVAGGDGDDTLSPGYNGIISAGTFAGGLGTDTFSLKSGAVITIAGAAFNAALTGMEVLDYYAADVLLQGDDGANAFDFSGFSRGLYVAKHVLGISGLDGDDVLTGLALARNALDGGLGDDVLTGGGELDTLSGGRGNDNLSGGRDRDILIGDNGNDVLSGGREADRLDGGDGRDILAFAGANESSGDGYDTAAGFNARADSIDVATAVTGIDDAVVAGTLSQASFSADLASAIGAAQLAAAHAVLFTPDAGDLAGQIFLVVDLNGAAGYQDNRDLVLRLETSTNLDQLDTGTFV